MFQATRRRLALWYTTITAVVLLVFASGVYLYVRTTLVERVDDTLNHVVEVVERSLVIEPGVGDRVLTAVGVVEPPMRVNVEASFRDNAETLEDDHIDLEWFGPTGQLAWTTLTEPLNLPVRLNPAGETVRVRGDQVLRQVTQRVVAGHQILGYLRVSHPWFEVTKPSRRLMVDLTLGTSLMVGAVALIGWLLSGIAIAPVRDSYQQLRQFTADASHELRNPIAVIQTNVQVALADPEADAASQQQQFLVIERLTRRLGRLVDDLLFLTRQESGLVTLQRHPVALGLVLQEVVEEQQAIAQEANLSLVYRPQLTLDEAATTILGDRDQLIRLFTNVISNGLQYTPSGGTVTVTLTPSRWQNQTALAIQVQDTGQGIAPEALPYVFDRFYRADPARTRPLRAAGSGLGLAIAKVIVDNHRGEIRLDSTPDQGTTVSVGLPGGTAGEGGLA
ncbi:MAG: HAMP domain-containing sensor histidine kinase [Leptolyngbya sp.]|nr:HAMP domain-containing sensor histidine kinase [Leptolyngbya sp.]